MCFGFQHADGWFALLVRTLERLAPLVAAWNSELALRGTRFEIIEVKQKFGRLRIIALPTNCAIVTALLDAREQSRFMCEQCGAAAVTNTQRILCECCRSDAPNAL